MQSVKTKPSIFDGIARRLSPLRYAMAPVVSLITLVCTEWIHRGELTVKVLTDNVLPHLPAFLLTWLLLGFSSLQYVTLRILRPVFRSLEEPEDKENKE